MFYDFLKTCQIDLQYAGLPKNLKSWKNLEFENFLEALNKNH